MGGSIMHFPWEDPESDALSNLGLKNFVSDIDLDILGLWDATGREPSNGTIGDFSTSSLEFSYWEFMFLVSPLKFDLLSDGEGRPGETAAALEILGEDRGEKASLLGEWLEIWGIFDVLQCSPLSRATRDGTSIARFWKFWFRLGKVSSVESPPAFRMKQKKQNETVLTLGIHIEPRALWA